MRGRARRAVAAAFRAAAVSRGALAYRSRRHAGASCHHPRAAPNRRPESALQHLVCRLARLRARAASRHRRGHLCRRRASFSHRHRAQHGAFHRRQRRALRVVSGCSSFSRSRCVLRFGPAAPCAWRWSLRCIVWALTSLVATVEENRTTWLALRHDRRCRPPCR